MTLQNKKLSQILKALDYFTQAEFDKEITITSIFRTQEEHDALYASTPTDKRPKWSPHMSWKAADIRSSDFTVAEKQRMLKLLNTCTYSSGQGKPVGLLHTIAGNVEHFHVQAD